MTGPGRIAAHRICPQNRISATIKVERLSMLSSFWRRLLNSLAVHPLGCQGMSHKSGEGRYQTRCRILQGAAPWRPAKPSVEWAAGRVETRFGGLQTRFWVSNILLKNATSVGVPDLLGLFSFAN